MSDGYKADDIFRFLSQRDPRLAPLISQNGESNDLTINPQTLTPSQMTRTFATSAYLIAQVCLRALLDRDIITQEEFDEIYKQVREEIGREFGIEFFQQ